METHEKIKQLRQLRGMSQDMLARLAGYSDRSSIAKIEAGKVDLSQSKIALLASALGVSPAELMAISEPTEMKPAPALSADAMKIAQDYEALPAKGQRLVRVMIDELQREEAPAAPARPAMKIIPLLGNSFAAGPGEPDFGNAWSDYEIPAGSPAEFAVRVTGDSMEPYLPDGSVQLCRKAAPRDGDVGAFLIDGEFLVKQMCIDMTGTLHLFSLNRDRKGMDRHLERNEDHTVLCFGTVIMKKRLPLPLD